MYGEKIEWIKLVKARTLHNNNNSSSKSRGKKATTLTHLLPQQSNRVDLFAIHKEFIQFQVFCVCVCAFCVERCFPFLKTRCAFESHFYLWNEFPGVNLQAAQIKNGTRKTFNNDIELNGIKRKEWTEQKKTTQASKTKHIIINYTSWCINTVRVLLLPLPAALALTLSSSFLVKLEWCTLLSVTTLADDFKNRNSTCAALCDWALFCPKNMLLMPRLCIFFQFGAFFHCPGWCEFLLHKSEGASARTHFGRNGRLCALEFDGLACNQMWK